MQGLNCLGANPKSGNRSPDEGATGIPSPSAKSRPILAFQTVGISPRAQVSLPAEGGKRRKGGPFPLSLPGQKHFSPPDCPACDPWEPHHSLQKSEMWAGAGLGQEDGSGSTRGRE